VSRVLRIVNSSLQAATPEETRAIEKHAWLCAFPMMESYNTWYLQAVD
jgi:chlorite dismutase